MKNKELFLCLVFFLGSILSGCAVEMTGGSYVAPSLPASWAVNTIAADAVNKISALYPPGHTALQLVRPMVKDSRGQTVEQTPADAFSRALEDRLRQRGFSIVPEAQIRLAWTLDGLSLDDGPMVRSKERPDQMNWWLRLKLADSSKSEVRTITRMYDGNGQALAGFAEQGQ